MSHRKEVFISYTHSDKMYFDELNTFLMSLKHNYDIEIWNDQMIKPGDIWKKEIREHMSMARIAILLVSQAFLVSDFVRNEELPSLVQAAKDEMAKLLWIPVTVSQVGSTLINNEIFITDFQAVCNPQMPLERLDKSNRNDIYNKLCEDIKRCFNEKVDVIKGHVTRKEVDRIFEDAWSDYDNGMLDMACMKLRRAINMLPQQKLLDDAKFFTMLGEIYIHQDKYAEAVDALTSSLELDSANAVVLQSRGICYNLMYRYEDAINDITIAINHSSNPISLSIGYYSRGLAYQEIGSFDKAYDDFTDAIRLDSNHVDAYWCRANLLYDLRKWEQAVPDYEKALQLGLDDARARDVKRILEELQQFRK